MKDIDELIINNKQEMKALANIVNRQRANVELDMKSRNFKFALLKLLDVVLYQDYLDTLESQTRKLEAIKEKINERD